MENLGDLIKVYRIQNKYSLRDFSKICGISHTYLDKLEKGVDPRSGKAVEPTLDTLEKVSRAMNMTLKSLLSHIGKIDSSQNHQDEDNDSPPPEFTSAEGAMKFIIQQPSLMAFGGYDLKKMTDDELIDFANELLNQLKLISYKYK